MQTNDGDLRVWSVAKSYSSDDPAKVVRILKRTENYQNAPNWMGWSKNGRIIQFSERFARFSLAPALCGTAYTRALTTTILYG